MIRAFRTRSLSACLGVLIPGGQGGAWRGAGGTPSSCRACLGDGKPDVTTGLAPWANRVPAGSPLGPAPESRRVSAASVMEAQGDGCLDRRPDVDVVVAGET